MTEDRIARLAKEIEDERHGQHARPLPYRIIGLIRAFAAECEEEGKLVECPTCLGDGPPPEYEGNAPPCPTCDGEGRIRRELAGALDVAQFLDEHSEDPSRSGYDEGFSTAAAIAFGRARNQWAAKAKEEAK